MVVNYLFNRGSSLHSSEDNSDELILNHLILATYEKSRTKSINFFTKQLDKNTLVNLKRCLNKRVYQIIEMTTTNEQEANTRKKKFNEILDYIVANIKQESKMPKSKLEDLINFGHDIIQFYAVLKAQHEVFNGDNSLASFNKYILANKKVLGDCSNNLFVVESRLIIAYKNISNINASLRGTLAPIDQPDAKISGLIFQIKAIQSNLSNKDIKNRSGIFGNYLDFLSEYVMIKICDCLALLKSKKQDPEKIEGNAIEDNIFALTGSQGQFVGKATEHLSKIVQHSTRQDYIIRVIGYCLGGDLFDRLPGKLNLKDLEEHIADLAKTCEITGSSLPRTS